MAGQPRKRVKTVEAGNYLDLAQAVAEAKVRLKRPDETKVVFCYEAGRDGFHPYRRLTELGHEVWVIDSASVSRKMRRAKSDGIDADKLSELMQRQAREEKALRIVRVPPLEVEDQRLLPRERAMLLEDLQRVRNRIESLLFTQGYREVPKRARDLRAWRHGRWARSCGSGSTGTSKGFRCWSSSSRRWERRCS
ncbi:MAG: IS110 family transposase [Gammaproteobacteria bacterium]